jgi:Uri superfamily endonuclease
VETLPGTYALILHALAVGEIAIGRLGMLQVRPGWYVYVGSAFGPGGIRGRVGRHLRGGAALHWHIDYLRRLAAVEEVWYTLDPAPQEHAWAQAFASLSGASVPMAGFGSSGCRCPAHLFYLTSPAPLDQLILHDCRKLKVNTQ